MKIDFRDEGLRIETQSLVMQNGLPGAVVLEGAEESLRVLAFPVKTAAGSAERITPLGRGTDEQWDFRDAGCQLAWTLCRLDFHPGFTLRAVFHNHTPHRIRLKTLTLCRADLVLAGAPSDWQLSGLGYTAYGGSLTEYEPAWKNDTLTYPDFMAFYSAVTRQGGVAGAIGPGEAEASIQVMRRRNAYSITAGCIMNDVIVEPGGSRASEEILFSFAPCREARELMFRWIAATHGARTGRGPVSGWCSWYDLQSHITRDHVESVTAAIRARDAFKPLQVIQVDEGYERAWGDWRFKKSSFPGGADPLVAAIRSAGAVPGIWLAPLGVHESTGLRDRHPDWFQKKADGSPVAFNWNGPGHYLDPTHPGVRAFLKRVLRKKVAEGFGYFKIDFNNIAPDCRLHDRTQTHFQAMRGLYRLYREALGEDVYLNACLFRIHRGAVGLCDAMRIAGDSGAEWSWIRNAILALGAGIDANGVLFAADPDVSYLLPRGRLNRDECLTWHSFTGLCGGVTMTSEPLHLTEYADAARLLEMTLPPLTERSHTLQCGTDPLHRRFGFAAVRSWGDFAVVCLWNAEDEARDVTLDFADLGIAGNRFHVWSLWDKTDHGVHETRYTTSPLPPHGCVVLRLTPAMEAASASPPILIGSDLHIGCGAMEVKEWVADGGRLSIRLTDAGARAGALFIHSRQPLSLVNAAGCRARVARGKTPDSWEMQIDDRQRGASQAVELRVGVFIENRNDPPADQPRLCCRMDWIVPPSVLAGQPVSPGQFRVVIRNDGAEHRSGAWALFATPASAVTLDRQVVDFDLPPGSVKTVDVNLTLSRPVRSLAVWTEENGQAIPGAWLSRLLRPLWPVLRYDRLVSPALEEGCLKKARSCRPRGKTAAKAAARFFLDPDRLVFEIRVRDPHVAYTEDPWAGSLVELFASPSPTGAVGHVCMQPSLDAKPPRAWLYKEGQTTPVDDVALRCKRTAQGYQLVASIPLKHLLLTADLESFLVEIQVSSVNGNRVRYATFFSSCRAYENTAQFAEVRVDAALF